jgi:hypothetical protein
MATTKTRTKRRTSGKTKRTTATGARKRATSGRGSTKTRRTSGRGSAKRTTASKRGSGARELLATPTGTFFARRTGTGQFKDLQERGRSLATDRRRQAKHVARPGHGDEGDRPRSSRGRSAKGARGSKR